MKNRTKSLSRLLSIFVIVVAVTRVAYPQVAKTDSDCVSAAFGADEAKAFLQFDSELRDALSVQDAGKIALLVSFPLRVNSDRGSYYIEDAQSLQGWFAETFPPAVLKVVLGNRAERISCVEGGILYGNGELRVNFEKKGFGIVSIDVSRFSRYRQPQKPGTVQFACQTAKTRAIVDTARDGSPRYRAWNKPRTLDDKPDIEIAKGTASVEGTDGCTHMVWTFADATTKVDIEELGCMPDSNQPPHGAVGVLDVSPIPPPPDTYVTPWCF